MSLFTIYDLIILALIIVLLLIFLKPKGVLTGVKIMLFSLKIFANNKLMFLRNILLLLFVHIIAPIILLAIIYGVAIILNIATDKISISFLHNFVAITSLIWMFGSLIIVVISYPLIISFAYIIFYRQLLQILKENNSEKKLSFKEITVQEIKNFPKMLKFFGSVVSIMIVVYLKVFSMMTGFLFSKRNFSINRYFLPNYARQIMCYVPMEYALYHNSSKQAVVKSYQINREWTALSVYGIATSFLVGMIIIFFICYFMSHINDLNALFNLEILIEKVGSTLMSVVFWLVFFAVIFSLVNAVRYNYFTSANKVVSFWHIADITIPLKMIVNSFYFIVYLNYNNSILEGKTDKFSKDFGLFGFFLDDIEDTLVKKFGSESMPIYEKYIPIKEEYKRIIEL